MFCEKKKDDDKGWFLKGDTEKDSIDQRKRKRRIHTIILPTLRKNKKK